MNTKSKVFVLDNNYSDEDAELKAEISVRKWIKKHSDVDEDKSYTIREMITEIAPEIYSSFSRGDKCRVGRAMSTLYNRGYFSELKRTKKKGATNAYVLR